MVADTWLLMQLYWRIDRREVTGRSKLRILALALGGIAMLLIGAFSAAVGYFSSFLLRPEMPVRVPPGLMPGLILTFILIGVLVTGLNQAVKSLFLSGDLDRLMVAPVHTRSVMVAKLLSRLPSSLLLLLLVGAPALVAYGIGMGAGPVYYLLGALFLLLAPLFGLSVGAVIAMLLVRWLPVNRVSELLAAAYAFLGIGFALLAQLPRLFINEDPEVMVNAVSGSGLLPFIERMDRLPIPTLWAGRGLVALDSGSIDAAGLLGILAYVLTTLGLFLLIVLTADRFYLSGWLKTQSAGGKRRGLEEDSGLLGRGSLAAAIGLKDWLLRMRDPRQLVNVLGSGLIAVVVGGLAIFRGSGGETSLMGVSQSGVIPATGGWVALAAALSPGVLMAAWALFVGFAFMSNSASYALAQEGGAFPMLKAAPIRPRDVWRAKTWSMVLPYVALFVVALLVSRLFVSYSLLWLPYALATGLLLGYGLMALNVSVGFRYANLAWTDPRRMITGGGGLVSFVLSVLYGLPGGLVTILGFGLAAVWPQWTLLFAAAALILVALYTWLWHVLMARWAVSAWDKLPV